MEDLQKKLVLCLVMALIIVILIPIYWARESGRQDAAVARIQEESVERGNKTFVSACGACHGQQGQGGVGPALRSADATLTRRVVRSGKGIMPPFGSGQISDRELDDVMVFLNSLATTPVPAIPAQTPPPKPVAPTPPPPAPAKTATPTPPAPAPTTPVTPAAPGIPKDGDLVRKGETLYRTASGIGCAICHGADASGGMGPGLRGTTAQKIRESLKSVSAMSSIKITDEEIEAIAAYLKSLGAPK
ncbi:MAG: cytochrome c [Chloroflexi bacterium]|nr:cytochrome c [Chloroflexota bacterium]